MNMTTVTASAALADVAAALENQRVVWADPNSTGAQLVDATNRLAAARGELGDAVHRETRNREGSVTL